MQIPSNLHASHHASAHTLDHKNGTPLLVSGQRKHLVVGLFVGLLVLSLGGTVAPVMAQNLKIYTQEIRMLYRTGKQLVQKKEYKRAILKFKAALALVEQSLHKLKDVSERQAMQKRKSGFLYIIGSTYQYDRQWAQAFLSYQQSLASGAEDKTAILATKHMALLRPKILVKVALQSTPEGAELTLVDALQVTHKGQTPYTHTIPPGMYQLTLRKSGYKTYQVRLRIRRKQGLTRSFELVKLLATMEIRSTPPGASLVLQGEQRLTGKTPMILRVPPGRYIIQVRMPRHLPQQATVELKPDMRVQRDFRLVKIKPKPRIAARAVPLRPLPPLPHPKRKAARAAGWSTLAIAALAGGGGVALYFLANGSIERFNARAGNPANQNDTNAIFADYTEGQNIRVVAHITVGVAAAAAITAMGMFIWNGGPQPTRAPPPLAPREQKMPTKPVPTATFGQTFQ